MTDYKLFPKQITEEMADAFWEEYSKDIADDLLTRCYKAMYATAPAVQCEPVGWQFYQYGRWWSGDDRIKDHRKNTEEAGIPTRNVYAAPQLPPDISKLVEALELISNTDPDEGTAWFHDIAHKALEAYHTEGINDVCF